MSHPERETPLGQQQIPSTITVPRTRPSVTENVLSTFPSRPPFSSASPSHVPTPSGISPLTHSIIEITLFLIYFFFCLDFALHVPWVVAPISLSHHVTALSATSAISHDHDYGMLSIATTSANSSVTSDATSSATSNTTSSTTSSATSSANAANIRHDHYYAMPSPIIVTKPRDSSVPTVTRKYYYFRFELNQLKCNSVVLGA